MADNDEIYDPDDGDLNYSSSDDDEDNDIDSPSLQIISDPPDGYSDLDKVPDQDNPLSDPADIAKHISDTHPSTDTNIEFSEEYDAGLSAASGADDPSLDEDSDDEAIERIG